MKISDKIKKSKSNIKEFDRLNITSQLHNFYEKLLERKEDKTFLSIVIVNIVSANESFFKETFAALFDFDSVYIEKSKNILKRYGSRIDVEDIFSITKSYFSLGDLIAYSLKYSSIESILKNFKEITDIDFLNSVKSIESSLIDYELDYLSTPERPIDKNRIITNLKEIYELRNIICHDFLSSTHKIELDYDKIIDYILDSLLLQEAITILLSDKIYSLKIPLEENDIIEDNKNKIKKCQKELNVLYKEIKDTFNSKDQFSNFEQNEKMFNQFVDSDSQHFGYWFRDFDETFPFASMFYEHKLMLMEERINFLKKHFD
ncbi:hypothetical protein SAMN05444411_1311 [Lutibacter oricola]|uniref:RiboL-PSP-HEPN domain-containing protein n=1 Tax=Lutibacter oricola TaxID=762486 RepID=A0A1H3H9X3_9FLAO|nr:hypothetical protein [Lutibacter oricola]SDY12383.1 hypothetical protein SAMN05444411_1311 [Lutibacter oricola]